MDIDTATSEKTVSRVTFDGNCIVFIAISYNILIIVDFSSFFLIIIGIIDDLPYYLFI